MNYVTEGLEPRDALQYFEQISAIPRGSGNEKQVADFVEAFAKAHGAETFQDEMHNLYLRKPATKGYENAPAVLLQGHLDMVCAKRSGIKHDFFKEPLKLKVQNGILSASGTTLGADDGVAVAYIMALFARENYARPKLEALLTVEEETGMGGSFAVNGSWFTARKLINLDGGPEGVTLTSCSGGMRAAVTKTCARESFGGSMLQIHIAGLRGGHSGQDIDKQRANANRLLGRILFAMEQELPCRLVSLAGGSKDNAIPCESSAVIAVDEFDAEAVSRRGSLEAADIAAELRASDPGFTCAIGPVKSAEQPFSLKDTRALVRLLYLFPDGIQTRSVEIEGLVLCSSNLGVVETEGETVRFHSAVRSPVETMRHELAARIGAVAGLCGAETETDNDYPGWPYVKESPLRELLLETYRALFGRDMKCLAIHAGVECGILLDKLPGLDIVSIGPDMHDYHTPEETLDLGSFARTLDLIVELLRRMK